VSVTVVQVNGELRRFGGGGRGIAFSGRWPRPLFRWTENYVVLLWKKAQQFSGQESY